MTEEAQAPHRWTFKPRFRPYAFGWKTETAILRIKEAISEIRGVRRKDPLLAAEGAVLLLEKLSPSLERVDQSSGPLGTAVRNAIEALVSIIGRAPATEETRSSWLDRIYDAYIEDEVPYLDSLGDAWGELCQSPEIASRWADRLLVPCRDAWSDEDAESAFFKGTPICLSALFAAERYDRIIELLELAPFPIFKYRQYGVRSLGRLGRSVEAITYAEAGRGFNDSETDIARVCEDVLIDAGEIDEAYERYGLLAHRTAPYSHWLRRLVKRYPSKVPSEILGDLVRTMPSDEARWFVAAKDAKLYGEAIALATRAPCDPRILTRAARDYGEKEPEFAFEAGLAALYWLVRGCADDLTAADVKAACESTFEAAERLGREDEALERIDALREEETFRETLVARVLDRELAQYSADEVENEKEDDGDDGESESETAKPEDPTGASRPSREAQLDSNDERIHLEHDVLAGEVPAPATGPTCESKPPPSVSAADESDQNLEHDALAGKLRWNDAVVDDDTNPSETLASRPPEGDSAILEPLGNATWGLDADREEEGDPAEEEGDPAEEDSPDDDTPSITVASTDAEQSISLAPEPATQAAEPLESAEEYEPTEGEFTGLYGDPDPLEPGAMLQDADDVTTHLSEESIADDEAALDGETVEITLRHRTVMLDEETLYQSGVVSEGEAPPPDAALSLVEENEADDFADDYDDDVYDAVDDGDLGEIDLEDGDFEDGDFGGGDFGDGDFGGGDFGGGDLEDGDLDESDIDEGDVEEFGDDAVDEDSSAFVAETEMLPAAETIHIELADHCEIDPTT